MEKSLLKHLARLISVLKEVALEKDSIVNCDETRCNILRIKERRKNMNVVNEKGLS